MASKLFNLSKKIPVPREKTPPHPKGVKSKFQQGGTVPPGPGLPMPRGPAMGTPLGQQVMLPQALYSPYQQGGYADMPKSQNVEDRRAIPPAHGPNRDYLAAGRSQVPLPLGDPMSAKLGYYSMEPEFQRESNMLRPGSVPGRYQMGGMPGGSMAAPWWTRSQSRSILHEGLVKSAVPGRTDRHNVGVLPGSYVVPADVVSHLGQGNTAAGGNALDKLLKVGPYGTAMPKLGGGKPVGSGPKLPTMKALPPGASGSMNMTSGPGGARGLGSFGGFGQSRKYAEGGQTHEGSIEGQDSEQGHVPIVIAGGEYVVHPTAVQNLGNGDMKAGHAILDAFVKQARQDHIKTLQKLPGPKT